MLLITFLPAVNQTSRLCVNICLNVDELFEDKKRGHLLEEILLAVDASCPGETFVRQRSLTVCALEALGVPVSVQHLQDELVQDVLTTAGTLRDLCRGDESTRSHTSQHGKITTISPGLTEVKRRHLDQRCT